MGLRGPDPYETACTHKWDFNVAGSGNISDGVGSLTATNSGATSTAASNGAYDYYFEGTDDSMSLGTGTTGVGSGNFTMEFVVSFDTSSTLNAAMSRDGIVSTKYWGWLLKSDVNSHIEWVNNSNNTQTVNLTSSLTVTTNVPYHIFVTGAPAGGTNNYNMYYMNGTTPTVTAQGTYAGSPDESQSLTIYFGRVTEGASTWWHKGTLHLIRVHNAVLTSAQMKQNFEAEGWRYGAYVSLGLTAPAATTTTTAPAPTQATTLTAPTAATTTTSKPALDIGPALVTPTGTTATTTPTFAQATTLIAPTGTTATNYPAPDVGPALVTPTGTTATIIPTFALATTLVEPTATTATNAPTQDLATTLDAILSATTATYTITVLSNSTVILITPTAITTTFAPSQDLATVLATPTATTITSVPTQGVVPLPLTTPTATTTTGAPSQDIATTLLATPTALTETDTPYQAIEIILITPTATSATSGLIITQWGAIEVLRATYDQNPISLEGMLKNTDMLTAVNKVTTELLSATYNLETPSLTAVSKNSGRLTAISEAIL